MTVGDIFRKIRRWTFKILLWGFITSFVYLVMCRWIMPPVTLTQLVNFVSGYGLKRDYVRMHEISANAKLAAMASEDQLFPDHDGFDWNSIEKSMKANPNKKNKVRGAGSSTISQQVAKNVFLWQGSGITRYIRKIPEIYFTFMIELIWGKKRILEVYLNIAEMGSGIFGIEAASKSYFNKRAKDLSRVEAAMIISCLPNPKRYTVKPVSSWVRWKHRKVLRQMANIQGDPDIQLLIY